jgi:hypothetical protein
MKKYLDFWSINHTLAGSLLAGIFISFNAPLLASVVIAFLMLIGWEFFEIFHHINETIQNRVSDMAVGMLGFFVTHYLMSHNIFNRNGLFSALFVLFLILEIWGFLAYEKIKNGKYL